MKIEDLNLADSENWTNRQRDAFIVTHLQGWTEVQRTHTGAWMGLKPGRPVSTPSSVPEIHSYNSIADNYIDELIATEQLAIYSCQYRIESSPNPFAVTVRLRGTNEQRIGRSHIRCLAIGQALFRIARAKVEKSPVATSG